MEEQEYMNDQKLINKGKREAKRSRVLSRKEYYRLARRAQARIKTYNDADIHLGFVIPKYSTYKKLDTRNKHIIGYAIKELGSMSAFGVKATINMQKKAEKEWLNLPRKNSRRYIGRKYVTREEYVRKAMIRTKAYTLQQQINNMFDNELKADIQKHQPKLYGNNFLKNNVKALIAHTVKALDKSKRYTKDGQHERQHIDLPADAGYSAIDRLWAALKSAVNYCADGWFDSWFYELKSYVLSLVNNDEELDAFAKYVTPKLNELMPDEFVYSSDQYQQGMSDGIVIIEQNLTDAFQAFLGDENRE